MPFTIGGDYIPEEPNYDKKRKPKLSPPTKTPTSKPLKVFKEKRKNSLITIIKNLPLTEQEIKNLAMYIKKKLGVGGSVKNESIEIQGDKVLEVKKILKERNMKFL